MINSPNAISGLKKIAALLLSGWLLSAQALEGFVVSDIRVEGAQNIEVGTIFNYLPVKVGDTIDNDLTNQSIKALFATGFFRDVELRQEGNVLVVIVAERPAVSCPQVAIVIWTTTGIFKRRNSYGIIKS